MFWSDFGLHELVRIVFLMDDAVCLRTFPFEPQAFVGCAWGIQNIGYVLMVGRAVNSLCSAVSGNVVKLTGRIPLFVFAYLVNMAGLLYLFYWEPRSGQIYALFAMAAILMMSDALWGTQINGEIMSRGLSRQLTFGGAARLHASQASKATAGFVFLNHWEYNESAMDYYTVQRFCHQALQVWNLI